MTIQEKYQIVRPLIKDGDIIIFRGTGIIAKTIQYCDKSWANHTGIVFKSHGALFIEDSNSTGVQSDRLSWRIQKYAGGDFKIIRPTADKDYIHEQLARLLLRGDNQWIQYDFINGIKELINRACGTKFKIKLRGNTSICSELTAEYAVKLGMMTPEFDKLSIAFPQDYLRYLDKNNAFIID